MRIRSGDMVEVRSGNARGTRAKVLAVKSGTRTSAQGAAAGSRLVVEGVNRVYRHIRRSQKNPQGGRLSKEMPIDASNVLFVCPACGKAVRLGVKTAADGSKVRVCRGCGAEHGVLARAKSAAKAANIKAGR